MVDEYNPLADERYIGKLATNFEVFNVGEARELVLFSQVGESGETITVNAESVGLFSFTSYTNANILYKGANQGHWHSGGKDTVILGSGNDIVNLNVGHDTVTGGAGNDTIDGGEGIDIAIFSGNKITTQ